LIHDAAGTVTIGVRVEQQSQQRDGRGAHRAPWSWGAGTPRRKVCVGVLIVIGLIVAGSIWRSSTDEEPAAALPDSSEPVPIQPTDIGPVAEPSLPQAPSTSVPAPRPSPTVRVAPRTAAPRPNAPAPKPRRPDGGRPPNARTVAPTRAPAPPAPAAATVSGTFRVVDTFSEAFIGEVTVANASGQAVNWQVSLQLPDTVTELRTSWVDGAPPPEVRRTGQTIVFTGSQPVPSGAVAPLRFQFARTGSRIAPVNCTVNDVRCVVAT
jgi:hypothetical protein